MSYKYNILIDIDGVVRDLFGVVSKALNKKKFTYEEGAIIFSIVKQNPLFLSTAPVTKYYSVIKSLIKNPIFVSFQKTSWRKSTKLWLEKHFTNFEIIFTDNAKDKLKYYKKANYIIEDYPYYDDYNKIILIDACYNKHVKNPLIRVKTKIELENYLKRIIGG